MRTSKTKQHINSSINCSSDQRSLERLGHACDRREHATIYLTASRGFTARTRHGCTSAGVLASRRLRPQHRGAGFPHPGLQMTAEDQPGREKPPSLDGEVTAPLPNPSNFSSPPGRTSLPSSHPKSRPSAEHPDSSLSPSATALTLPLTAASFLLDNNQQAPCQLTQL